MSLLVLPKRKRVEIPSWENFAIGRRSELPNIWEGLVRAYCPFLGKTRGLRLYDLITNVDAIAQNFDEDVNWSYDEHGPVVYLDDVAPEPYFNVRNHPNLGKSDSWSITVYFKRDVSGVEHFFYSEKVASSADWIEFNITNTNRFYARQRRNYAFATIWPTDTVNTTEWHMVNYVRVTDGNYKLYFDGQLIGSSSTSIGISSTNCNDTFLGSETVGGPGNDFNGKISYWLLHERALDESEVRELYDNKFGFARPVRYASFIPNTLAPIIPPGPSITGVGLSESIPVEFALDSSVAEGRYWVNDVGNNNWFSSSNWSATDGGGGGAGVPTIDNVVYFTTGSTDNCNITADVIVNSIDIQSGYNGTLDNQNHNIWTSGDVIFSDGSVNMGISGLWNVSGTFNAYDMSAGNLDAESSTLIMHGSGEQLYGFANANSLYNVAIESGANIILTTADNNFLITNDLSVSGLFNLVSETITVSGGDIYLHPSGSISGVTGSTLRMTPSEFVWNSGALNLDILDVRFNSYLSPNTYQANTTYIRNTENNPYTFYMSTGNYVFGGDLQFQNTGSSTYTIDTSASGHPFFRIQGQVDSVNNAGTLTWNMGTGTFTCSAFDYADFSSLNHQSGVIICTGVGNVAANGSDNLWLLKISDSGNVSITGDMTFDSLLECSGSATISSGKTITIESGMNVGYVSTINGGSVYFNSPASGEGLQTYNGRINSDIEFFEPSGGASIPGGRYGGNFKISNNSKSINCILSPNDYITSGNFELEANGTGNLVINNTEWFPRSIQPSGDLIFDINGAGNITMDCSTSGCNTRFEIGSDLLNQTGGGAGSLSWNPGSGNLIFNNSSGTPHIVNTMGLTYDSIIVR
jgi:hypothetical protein